jgi:hypothetical protein
LCTEVNDGGTLTATTPTSNGICNAWASGIAWLKARYVLSN